MNNQNVITTLDSNIQTILETCILSYKGFLQKKGAKQAAGIILDAHSLDVLALVGSYGYNKDNFGYNNGVLAKRSVGSLIKPFLYAFAFDNGLYPSFILPDVARSYKIDKGDYLPLNANRKVYGPVSIRMALGNSLNIPAVYLYNELNSDKFYELLSKMQLVSPDLNLSNDMG